MQSQTAFSAYPSRRSFLGASVGVLAASSLASGQRSVPAAVKTGYAPVNGLKMYYEIHGTGEPLVLIHGGVVGITMFGPNVEALAKGRQVIAVELQGHGHTADIDRPMSCEAMADDIAALIKYLGLAKSGCNGLLARRVRCAADGNPASAVGAQAGGGIARDSGGVECIRKSWRRSTRWMRRPGRR